MIRPTRPTIHLGTTRMYSWQEIGQPVLIALFCFMACVGVCVFVYWLAGALPLEAL